MICFTALFYLAGAIAGIVALPAADITAPHHLAVRSTPNETGISGGYYYNFYSDGGGSVNYTNGAEGQYSVEWFNAGSFFGGKGWNPGSNRWVLCKIAFWRLCTDTPIF
jgi:endo-1,4-beta-xylanase